MKMKLSSLKFTLGMLISDEVEAMTVDKPLEAGEITKQVGDISVTFHSLTKTNWPGGGYALKVGLTATSDKRILGFDWQLFGRLLGTNGKQFCGHDIGRDSGDNRAAEYTVHYSAGYATPNPPGEPAKWVLEIPTKVNKMRIPVYFKDLPLP